MRSVPSLTAARAGIPVEAPAPQRLLSSLIPWRCRRTRSVSSELQRPWALLVHGFAICLSARDHADQSIKVQSKCARRNGMPLMGNPTALLPPCLTFCDTVLNANTRRTKPDNEPVNLAIEFAEMQFKVSPASIGLWLRDVSAHRDKCARTQQSRSDAASRLLARQELHFLLS